MGNDTTEREEYSEWLMANESIRNKDHLIRLLDAEHRFDEFLGERHAHVPRNTA